MKSLKFILAGFAGLSLAGTASALDIYIAGSNGDRASTNTAIKNLFTGSSTFAGTNADPKKQTSEFSGESGAGPRSMSTFPTSERPAASRRWQAVRP